jgi:signal peptidase I
MLPLAVGPRVRSGVRLSMRLTAWLIIIAATAVVTAAFLVPRLTGATPYTVLTGSMSPSLPAGTLVVMRPAEQVAVGDVITYQLRSGDPTVVTHRVVSTSVDTATGETLLHTQGDANASPDPDPVHLVQVRGKLWYSVPHLGRVTLLLSGHERQIAVDVAAALLLGYAATILATDRLADRRRRRVELATHPRHRRAIA